MKRAISRDCPDGVNTSITLEKRPLVITRDGDQSRERARRNFHFDDARSLNVGGEKPRAIELYHSSSASKIWISLK